MKRKIMWGVTSLVLLIVTILGVKIHQKVALEHKVSEEIQTIPMLYIYSSENEKEDIRTMVTGRPLVLIYFNTDCHFCQSEVKSITDNPELTQAAEIILISDQSFLKLSKFDQEYNLSSFSHIQTFRDPDHQFYQVFGTDIHPNTYIYGDNGRLLKHFKGEVDAEAMIRIVMGQ